MDLEISPCGEHREAVIIHKARGPVKEIQFAWLTQGQVKNTWLEANSPLVMAEMRADKYKITAGTILYIHALLHLKPTSAT